MTPLFISCSKIWCHSEMGDEKFLKEKVVNKISL